MISEIFCDYCGAANSTASSFCHACGRALKPNQAPGPTQVTQAPTSLLLNQRYRRLNPLGKGGQGEVYLVEDTNLADRLRAAKKLQPSSISSPKAKQEAIDAFEREAMMLANLKHSNLPEIYDRFKENDDYYLIMELIPGETLEDHLEKLKPGRLPIAEVLRIGIELATVLNYLHTRIPPIIFRDLKPGNIMLTLDKRVYLIDFGIARHFKPGQKKDTMAWGSTGYSPPEQYGSTQTTILSDIYSLGAIMHQLLSGLDPTDHPLFQFPTLSLQGHPQTALAELVMQMVKSSALERPASAAMIKSELQNALQVLQSPFANTVNIANNTLSLNRNTANTLHVPPPIQKQGPTHIPPTITLAPSIPVGGLLYKYIHTTSTIHTLAWSPNDQYLAAAGEKPAEIYLWEAITEQSHSSYKAHERPIQVLAWSPDSHLLASASNDHFARIWQAGNGRLQSEYTGHTHWIQALAWSPDGLQLASGDANKQIHLWDIATGRQLRVYRGHNSAVLALAYAPDGKRIASAEDDGPIQVWDTAHGTLIITYTGHRKAVTSLAWSPDGKQIVSGSWDTTLHIWEADTGQQLLCYRGHQRLVNTVAWSVANNLIASGSKDKTVQIWHPQTGQEHFIYRGHTASVNVLSWSPGGVYLASAGDDSVVHVWRAN